MSFFKWPIQDSNDWGIIYRKTNNFVSRVFIKSDSKDYKKLMLREKTQMTHIKIDLFQKARCPLNIIHKPNILHHNLNARWLLQNDLSQFIDEHHTTYEFW